MSMLTLERDRRTSPARLGKIALGAVFAGVVGLLFVAPMIVRLDYTGLSSGERVSTRLHGFGNVVSTDEAAGTVTMRSTYDGSIVTVSADEVTEQ